MKTFGKGLLILGSTLLAVACGTRDNSDSTVSVAKKVHAVLTQDEQTQLYSALQQMGVRDLTGRVGANLLNITEISCLKLIHAAESTPNGTGATCEFFFKNKKNKDQKSLGAGQGAETLMTIIGRKGGATLGGFNGTRVVAKSLKCSKGVFPGAKASCELVIK